MFSSSSSSSSRSRTLGRLRHAHPPITCRQFLFKYELIHFTTQRFEVLGRVARHYPKFAASVLLAGLHIRSNTVHDQGTPHKNQHAITRTFVVIGVRHFHSILIKTTSI